MRRSPRCAPLWSRITFDFRLEIFGDFCGRVDGHGGRLRLALLRRLLLLLLFQLRPQFVLGEFQLPDALQMPLFDVTDQSVGLLQRRLERLLHVGQVEDLAAQLAQFGAHALHGVDQVLREFEDGIVVRATGGGVSVRDAVLDFVPDQLETLLQVGQLIGGRLAGKFQLAIIQLSVLEQHLFELGLALLQLLQLDAHLFQPVRQLVPVRLAVLAQAALFLLQQLDLLDVIVFDVAEVFEADDVLLRLARHVGWFRLEAHPLDPLIARLDVRLDAHFDADGHAVLQRVHAHLAVRLFLDQRDDLVLAKLIATKVARLSLHAPFQYGGAGSVDLDLAFHRLEAVSFGGCVGRGRRLESDGVGLRSHFQRGVLHAFEDAALLQRPVPSALFSGQW